jgi:hypothetical protein
VAVDAGRILASDKAGKLVLLDRNGQLLHAYAVKMAYNEYEAALSGDTFVVNRSTRLDVYAVADGALLRKVQVAGRWLTAAGGFAAVTGNGLRLVRLADGAVVQARPAEAKTVALAAALEPTGLFELYVGAGPSRYNQRLGFEPLSRLRADFTAVKP